MLITRETDYALRILRALSGGGQCTIEDICHREATPKPFAYRITKKLEQSGWVAISRGVEGGCRLTANLNEVTLYQLIMCIGTDKGISPCLNEEYECSRAKACGDPCRIRHGLRGIQDAIDEELKRHTLAALILGTQEPA